MYSRVVESGRRFRDTSILRKYDPAIKPEVKLGGVWRAPVKGHWFWDAWEKGAQYPARKISKKIYGKPYHLTPFQALSDLALRDPVRWIALKGFDRHVEPGWLLQLALVGIPLSSGTWAGYEWVKDWLIESKAENEIEKSKDLYDDLIANDFQFHEIKMALEAGKITQKEAREKTLLHLKFVAMFHEYFNSEDALKDPDKDFEVLLHMPLFAPILEISEKGLPEVPRGHLRTKNYHRTVSQEKIEQILFINHQQQLQYLSVQKFVRGGREFAEFKQDPNNERFIRSVTEDPFRMELIEARNTGLLTDGELRFRLQEDIANENLAKINAELGMIPMLNPELGEMSKPLTLRDQRDRMAAQIVDSYKKSSAPNERPLTKPQSRPR